MTYLVSSLVNGLVFGLLLFMVSAGLTLIFGMMGVLNFAHSSLYMLGAYLGYSIGRWTGFWPALLLAPVAVALLGGLIERFMLRRVHGYGHAQELLLTFGLALIIHEAVKLVYGPYPVDYSIPSELARTAFSANGLDFPLYRLFIGAVAVWMFASLYLLMKYTRVGLIVRAALSHPRMVESLGHNVGLVFLLVFAVGAALAGLAGAVAGAFYPTGPNMAEDLGSIVFVVVVVGGLGSLEGALLASLAIGLLTTLTVGLDWTIAGALSPLGLSAWAQSLGGPFTITLSSLTGSLPFIIMLLVLLIRPAGLMGERA
ncbi:branched-chain amino acid ABC transporter permease [Bradyrhizobium pachyrhizi]|uniref:Branched-chain amino acid ABC transporter permease n=1 Tax=Bradyrhizobium pachyrhizi TaxID=280333 RepID=A0A844SUP3_9BRAD|nr:branched-chain amino acid ABC transporter permease [Bradyrhizobium pachyrhizi]